MRVSVAITIAISSLAVVVACSDDDDGGGSSSPDGSASGSAGAGAQSGTGGTSGSGGISSGGASSGGSSGAGSGGTAGGSSGTGGSGGAGGGSADGGQPIGALCVNDTNCSQAQGKAVCCAADGCVAPCECQLEANCPGGSAFLPCNTGADCKKYGGGKVCCEVQTGGSSMRFCTKQNGCSGQVIP